MSLALMYQGVLEERKRHSCSEVIHSEEIKRKVAQVLGIIEGKGAKRPPHGQKMDYEEGKSQCLTRILSITYCKGWIIGSYCVVCLGELAHKRQFPFSHFSSTLMASD